MTRRTGLTLLELLVTITLIVLMVGFASFNYMQIVEEQKRGKARNECREFIKALKVWEDRKGVAIGPMVVESGLPPRPFTLMELQRENIVKTVPEDPWSMPYELDTTAGVVMSAGPDRERGTVDDIAVPFRARFSMIRAFRERSDDRIVAIEFTRGVDRRTVSTATLSIVAGQPLAVTTISAEFGVPCRLRVHLADRPPPSAAQVVATTAIRARDGAALEVGASGGLPIQ